VFANLKAGLVACCALLLFVSGNARAELIAVPALKARVTDLTQTLSTEQQTQLEAKLTAFEQEKGSQIAVLIVPTTQPEDIAQYSIRVVDAWKLGRAKQDDGILILLAKNDRKMRIEVGYGLEGAIPDLTAKRVITEVMAPSFRQGDYYGGLNNAIDKLIGLVAGEQLPAPASNATSVNNNFEGMLPMLLVGGLVLGGILRAIFGSFFGGALTGGALGTLAWLLGGGLFVAIFFGIVAFFITLMGASGLGHMGGYSGGSGGFGGGGGGSDPFSGGGGGFGGGGASGDW
jgi:uncharacterized protein